MNRDQGQALRLAFFIAAADDPGGQVTMTQSHSRARQKAEIAFSEAQSQFLGRETAIEEHVQRSWARAENTLRLKKARMAKELADRASRAAGPRSKPGIKA